MISPYNTISQILHFSWHEVGCYDIPATIDYILNKTGHEDLYYIGYSQGTTSFYVMGSERSEYNSKIRAMVSMAPIAFLSNQRSPLLKCIVHFYNLMEVRPHPSYSFLTPTNNIRLMIHFSVGILLLQHSPVVPS